MVNGCFCCGNGLNSGLCMECIARKEQLERERQNKMSRPIGTLTVIPTEEETRRIKGLCGEGKPWKKTNEFILDAIREKLANDPQVAYTTED